MAVRRLNTLVEGLIPGTVMVPERWYLYKVLTLPEKSGCTQAGFVYVATQGDCQPNLDHLLRI